MTEYEKEMSHSNEYNYVLVNDDLEECVKKVIDIIDYERNLNN